MSKEFDSVSSQIRTNADTAIANFDNWDSDKNFALSEDEFEGVLASENSSVLERNSAKMFLENFESAKNISVAGNTADLQSDLPTKEATAYYNSLFSGDSDGGGVSFKDVAALSLLTNESNVQKAVDSIRNYEFESKFTAPALAAGSLFAGINAPYMLIKEVPNAGSPLRTAFAIGATAAFAYASYKLGEGAWESAKSGYLSPGSNDLEQQIRRRQNMLASWQAT